MWELIRSNQRKSTVLLSVMGVVLVCMGGAFGAMVAPGDPGTIAGFMLLALAIWLVMLLVSFVRGEKVLLASARAREIEKKDAPQLFNVVEEMAIAAGLGVVPKVYLIDTPTPNAFAVGLKPERAAVAVTTGLLARLNRDELQGVIAHEIAHIQNRDTRFMTLAGVTLGAVVILSELALRAMRFSMMGSGRRRSSSKGSGQLMIVMMVASVVLAILAPIMARLLYFACSRRREYLADACAAQYTRYPVGLASALQKISDSAVSHPVDATVSKTLAPMYIVNPLAAHGGRAGWFSTHPPTKTRIQILRGMTEDSSLAAYEEAFRTLNPKGEGLTPGLLSSSVAQPVREASEEEKKSSPTQQWRQVQNLLHKVNKYALLMCACGVNIRVPPAYSKSDVVCPKCGTVHPVSQDLFLATQVAKHMS